jgi:hypothetical protein
MHIFFHVVDESLCDTDDTNPLEFRHEDEAHLKRVGTGFTRGRDPLHGCAGAIDGIAIKIEEPWARTTVNPFTYFNRIRFSPRALANF